MIRIRARFTYANVMATIAVLIALMGSGSALALVITGTDVKNGSLTGKDVKDRSLALADLSRSTRSTLTQAQPWEKIPSGTTVTGAFEYDSQTTTGGDFSILVNLPGLARTTLTSDVVNFANDADPATTENDASCTGSVSAPTAPAGHVCVYLNSTHDTELTNIAAQPASWQQDHAFVIYFTDPGLQSDSYLNGSWAYTAQ